MPSYPRTASAREVARVLLKKGFDLKRQSGGHAIFAKGGVSFPVPMHPGDLKPRTFRSILDQAGITREQFFGGN